MTTGIVDARVAAGLGGQLDVDRVVDRDDDLGRPVERGDPVEPLAGRLLGDDQEAGHAARDHHLGLADLGDGEPDGAGLELALREDRRLVALGVRPPGDAVVAQVARDRGRVALEDVEIEREAGGHELGDGAADDGRERDRKRRWQIIGRG